MDEFRRSRLAGGIDPGGYMERQLDDTNQFHTVALQSAYNQRLRRPRNALGSTQCAYVASTLWEPMRERTDRGTSRRVLTLHCRTPAIPLAPIRTTNVMSENRTVTSTSTCMCSLSQTAALPAYQGSSENNFDIRVGPRTERSRRVCLRHYRLARHSICMANNQYFAQAV